MREFATKNHILLTNSNYYERQQPFICVISKAVSTFRESKAAILDAKVLQRNPLPWPVAPLCFWSRLVFILTSWSHEETSPLSPVWLSVNKPQEVPRVCQEKKKNKLTRQPNNARPRRHSHYCDTESQNQCAVFKAWEEIHSHLPCVLVFHRTQDSLS